GEKQECRQRGPAASWWWSRQETLRGSGVAAVAPAHGARRTVSEERPGRVDDEAAAERLAADQHPEPHRVAIAERHLGVDLAPHEHESHRHDETLIDVPRRTAHTAHVEHGALDAYLIGGGPLPRTDAEAHPGDPVAI